MSSRSQHPEHLAQGGDRVAEVLQHLVGVHQVERIVGELQRVDVADLEPQVGGAELALRGADDIGGKVDTDDFTAGDPGCEVGRATTRATGGCAALTRGDRVCSGRRDRSWSDVR